MSEIVIEQVLYRRPDFDSPGLLARSVGLHDTWLADCERLVAGFGERPAGVRCDGAVFALPLDKARIAIVQVSDEPGAQPPRALFFRFLVVGRKDYLDYLGDPFAVAERFPPNWSARGDLTSLSMPAEPLPPRTVEQVQEVLKRVKKAALVEGSAVAANPQLAAELAQEETAAAEGPALLGGAQLLVDGGKLFFRRPAPDTGLMRGLWTLLPTTTRNQLWPASFAFSNQLGFDALIVPPSEGLSYIGYTTEDQAAEYPTGRYELSLQTAAEAGDQKELDALFGRRSFNDTWRLALTLLVVFAVVVLAIRFLGPPPEPPDPAHRLPTDAERREIAGYRAGAVGAAAADPWTALTLIHLGEQRIKEMRSQR